jgi:hypothetical protein
MFDTNKNKNEKLSVSKNRNEENLNFIQEYRKLLVEKKYEKALSIINEAGTEKTQDIIKQNPKICPDVIRCLVFSGMYFDIYLLLDRDKDALDKFEEIIGSLSAKQHDMILHTIFHSRLILYSRLNRINDFVKECNSLRLNSNKTASLLGYAYGTIGYAVKKDYEKAEQYLSFGKQIYIDIIKDQSVNTDLFMQVKHIFEEGEFYLNVLRNEYEMKFIRKKPTVRNTNDGYIEIIISVAFEFISKKTGKTLQQEELNLLIKKWQEEKEQEQKNKLQDDPFLRELRTNSQETNSQNTLEK